MIPLRILAIEGRMFWILRRAERACPIFSAFSARIKIAMVRCLCLIMSMLFIGRRNSYHRYLPPWGVDVSDLNIPYTDKLSFEPFSLNP